MKSLNNFPFLKKQKYLFTGLLNRYFTILSYFARKNKFMVYILIDEVLSLAFTDRVAILDNYNATTIFQKIYPGQREKFEIKQFKLLDAEERFIVAAMLIHIQFKTKLDEQGRKQLQELVTLLAIFKTFYGSKPFLPIVRLKKRTVQKLPDSGLLGEVNIMIRKYKKWRREIANPEHDAALVDYLEFLRQFYQKYDRCLDGRLKRLINSYYAVLWGIIEIKDVQKLKYC